MVQESALSKPTTEPLLRTSLLASLLTPTLPRAPQFAGEGLLIFVTHAAVREERCEDIHLCPVGPCSLADLLRRLEAFALPCEAPVHDPRQHAGQLTPELLREPTVLLGRGYCDRPRYEPNAPPDGGVGAPYLGLVVGGQVQRVGRLEVEPLRPHKAGADGVLAGQVLDQRLGQAPALLRLR